MQLYETIYIVKQDLDNKALKELEQSSAEERIIFEAIDAAVAEGTDTSAASFFESPALLPLALTCSASS